MDVQAIVTGADPARPRAAEMSLGQDPRAPKQLSPEEIEMCDNSTEVKKAMGNLDICDQEIEKKYRYKTLAPRVVKQKRQGLYNKLKYVRGKVRRRELSKKIDEYHRTRSDRDIESQLKGNEAPTVDMPRRLVPETVLDLLWDDGGPMITLLEAIEINGNSSQIRSQKKATAKLPATSARVVKGTRRGLRSQTTLGQ